MLNWIVWNRTDYLHKNGFGVKQPTKVDMQKKTKKNNQPINSIIFFFDIELFHNIFLFMAWKKNYPNNLDTLSYFI